LIDAAASLTRVQLVAISCLIALFCMGSVLAYVRSKPRPITIDNGTVSAGAPERERTLTVHVAGAIVSPGLYKLPEGSRVADAIERAGGASSEAALDDINLAGRLTDGQKVMVPQKASVGTAPGENVSTSGQSSLVNVNTANADELEKLPGIGPAMAERIIEYRKKNGPFSAADDLDDVEGIGPAKLKALQDLVTI